MGAVDIRAHDHLLVPCFFRNIHATLLGDSGVTGTQERTVVAGNGCKSRQIMSSRGLRHGQLPAEDRNHKLRRSSDSLHRMVFLWKSLDTDPTLQNVFFKGRAWTNAPVIGRSEARQEIWLVWSRGCMQWWIKQLSWIQPSHSVIFWDLKNDTLEYCKVCRCSVHLQGKCVLGFPVYKCFQFLIFELLLAGISFFLQITFFQDWINKTQTKP